MQIESTTYLGTLTPKPDKLLIMRTPIIVANWKMHKTVEEGLELTRRLIEQLKGQPSQNMAIILCPAFIHLDAINHLISSIEPMGLYLGAQNCHYEACGPFTGEISAAMLRSVGVQYVIVGHSERRQGFKEGRIILAAKLSSILMQQMHPILCCGEDWQTREKGQHIAWVTQQVTDSIWHISETEITQLIIAYEPIWAIGTGQMPGLPEIVEMHQAIKERLAQQYGPDIAANIPILYGGSCNAQNAAMLLSHPAIDGLLVGGASLQIHTFLPIIQAIGNQS